jgi:hypothetical protein
MASTPSVAAETHAGADPLPELQRLAGRLRASMAALFDALALDPGKPQSVARSLEVDKTLAWRACRFTRASEATDALGYLPGDTALDYLWTAARKAGAPAERLETAAAAASDLREHIQRHAGGRQGLRRLLANLDAESGRAGLQDDGRRQAFGGNVAIWGVQATSRIGFHAIAPNAEDPERLDLISVGGLHELHRLRASARWPIIRETVFRDAGDDLAAHEPIDPSVTPGEPPLLKAFCSEDLPALRSRSVRDGTVFELDAGGLGRTAAVTCLFGMIHRATVPRRAAAAGEYGEHFTFLNTPVERAVVDVAVHTDLAEFGAPELQLCSLMESAIDFGPDDGSRYVLPVAERVTELAGEHPVLETPCLPRYRELVEMCLDRLGHPTSAFRFYRVELAHPPIPTVAVLRQALPHD